MLEALKEFQLQRVADFYALAGGMKSDERPQSATYTAVVTAIIAQLLLILLTKTGRRIIFTTVDTVLAVILVLILLISILSLPLGAVYIGVRGSLLMARSLSENFPTLGLVLRPLLAAVGQRVAAGTAAAVAGAGGEAAAAGFGPGLDDGAGLDAAAPDPAAAAAR